MLSAMLTSQAHSRLLNTGAILAGTGQAAVAAGASRQLLQQYPHKHIIYLTDRAHVLHQQAAVFSSHLGVAIGR